MNFVKSNSENNMYQPIAYYQFEKQKVDKQMYDSIKNLKISPPKNIKELPIDDITKPRKTPIL